MSRKRRRPSRPAGGSGRRGFLFKLGGGVAIIAGSGASLLSSDSFSLTNAIRNTPVDAAAEGNGIVGVVRRETEKKNSQEPMVKFVNNTNQPIDAKVTLRDPTDGTLYNNDGVSDNKEAVISLPVQDPPASAFADIEASVTGEIPYDILISEQGGSDFQLLTSGSILAESGNTKDTVRIKKPSKDQDFTANVKQDNWDLKALTVQDIKAPTNLDEAVLEVKVDGKGTVGSKTIDISNTGNNDTYSQKDITIPPNQGETVDSGTQYTLEVTASDTDGVTDTATVDDTP
jgi:hypothetical protein